MFDAQLLIAKGTGGGSPYSVYSPWFGRGGDYLRASAELVACNTTSFSLTIQVETKASDVTGDGTAVSGSIVLDGSETAPETSQFEAINQLVRYKYTVSSTAGDWILFRMLAPVWFDKT